MSNRTLLLDHPQPLLEQLHMRSSSSEMHGGNSVQLLQDSRENFPAWLEAVAAAEHYVLIEMYIFAANDFGVRLRDLLVEKCRQGVSVVLVYDWIGSLWPSVCRFLSRSSRPARKWWPTTRRVLPAASACSRATTANPS